ncbi:hypothetical protein [Zunongwangia sp. H14]
MAVKAGLKDSLSIIKEYSAFHGKLKHIISTLLENLKFFEIPKMFFTYK